jgi:hypothetical protein
MILFALVLAALGAVVTGFAARGLWLSRPLECEMPSPDGEPCSGDVAHMGWHHHQGTEWYGDVWRLPTDTVLAQQPRQKMRLEDRVLLSLGITLLVSTLIIVISLLAQPHPKHGHEFCVGNPALGTPICGNTDNCAMYSVDLKPGQLLCPDSPDSRDR